VAVSPLAKGATERYEFLSLGQTWPWAQLEAGSYGLPGRAVVLSPWVLTTRVARPRRRGFTRVTNPARWSRVRQARGIVADYPDPWDLLVVIAFSSSGVTPRG